MAENIAKKLTPSDVLSVWNRTLRVLSPIANVEKVAKQGHRNQNYSVLLKVYSVVDLSE
jgi:hypothetical protein